MSARLPDAPRQKQRLGELVRSALAGGAATLTDLVVLGVLVALHVSPRIASLPALVAGGLVNFWGNRHFAFRAGAAPGTPKDVADRELRRQALLYLITELIALGLNGVLYDHAVRWLHPTGPGVIAIRLVTQNLVFVLWSFPVWRKVFRPLVHG